MVSLEKVARFDDDGGNEIQTEGGKRKIRNVNLQRRYRDGDAWKSSSSLGLGDLPQAIEVLRRAMDYVAGQEAEVG